MTDILIVDKEHAEYNIRFSEREMNFWRSLIAKEEQKEQPNQKEIDKLLKFYNKYWNINIQSKIYLGWF